MYVVAGENEHRIEMVQEEPVQDSRVELLLKASSLIAG
jgi:chromatin segregation and condensation protein Rec8/ScpA/Scc1 (kleisin family)